MDQVQKKGAVWIRCQKIVLYGKGAKKNLLYELGAKKKVLY